MGQNNGQSVNISLLRRLLSSRIRDARRGAKTATSFAVYWAHIEHLIGLQCMAEALGCRMLHRPSRNGEFQCCPVGKYREHAKLSNPPKPSYVAGFDKEEAAEEIVALTAAPH